MQNTAVMDAPEQPNILKQLSEYWGYLAVLGGAIVFLVGFIRKYVWRCLKFCGSWCHAAFTLPLALQAIKSELQFENGMSLRQKLTNMDDNLVGLRQLVTFETISRRAILDSVDAPIFEFGSDGKFQWGNKACLKMSGCEMRDLLGDNWFNMIAGPEREETMDGWRLAVLNGTDYKTKFRVGRDTDEIWVRFSAICNRDELDTVLKFTARMWEIPDPRHIGGIHVTEA